MNQKDSTFKYKLLYKGLCHGTYTVENRWLVPKETS